LRFDEIFRVEQAHDLDRGEIALSGNGTESVDTAKYSGG
jgi:hypothetical protein